MPDNFACHSRRLHPHPARDDSRRSRHAAHDFEAACGRRKESQLRPDLHWCGLLAALAGCDLRATTPDRLSTTCSMVDGFATFFRVIVIVVGILTRACRRTAS